MKKNRKPIKNNIRDQNNLSRREAIKKVGYAAIASSTMLLLLNNPTKVHAQTPGHPGDPGGPPGDWDDDAWGKAK